MNADLQLGKLTLSLWGGVHFEVEKLLLSEKGSQGAKPLVALNDFNLEVSLASIFSGKPSITLSVKKPEFTIEKGLDGKLNVSKLSKTTAAQPGAPAATSSQNSHSAALPFELSFHIVDGKVIYADLAKKTKTEIEGINFDLKKFGLNSPFSFSFNSNLDAKEMKDLVLHGAAEFHGTAAIYLGASGLDHVDLETDVDLSGLTIKYAKLFNKTEKAPLKIAVKLSTTDKSLKLEKTHLQVNDAAIDMSGTVDNFSAPVVNLHVVSTKFVFEHWQAVLAPLKEFDVKGNASFDIKVLGPSDKLAFQGKAEADNLSLKAPGLVPRVTELKTSLNFTNDTASLSQTSLKMGASDLSMDGTVKNFARPVIVFNVHSQLLDVDSLLPQKPASETKTAENEKTAAAAPQEDIEQEAKGPIAQLKANPTARGLDFTGRLQVAKMHVHKADLTNLKAELTFKDLVMALKQASANTFGGAGTFNSTIDFRGADPAYSAVADVSGIDMNAAVSNQMPSAKDSLFGKAYSHFEVAGVGLSKAKVNSTLKGKGNFRIENGSWSGLKAMQQVGEYLKKIPGAQAALGNVNVTDKFKELKSDFTIAGGKFNIVNMIAEMEGARTGITGLGYVDFDQNMHLAGKIMTPAGDDVPKDIRGSDGRLNVPYEINCKASAPCLKMDAAARLVATAYAKKVGGQLLKKAIENNTDNPTIKNLLNKLPF
jgi:hypothetical protein